MNATLAAMNSGTALHDTSDGAAEFGLFDAELPDERDMECALNGNAIDPMDPAAGSIHRQQSAQVAARQLDEWIEAIADRDERALSLLYDATMSRVYGIALRVVRRSALAEEVVEETYFQVWRQAARFDPRRGPALAWLLGMTRSRAIDALRREARFPHDDSAHDCEDPKADDLLDAARSHAELHRALMRLNAQPRQLVAMSFFKGLSHEEIASQTALPLGTVKTQIRRALLTLRQSLGDGGTAALAS